MSSAAGTETKVGPLSCTEEHAELKSLFHKEHQDIKDTVIGVQDSLEQHVTVGHKTLLTAAQIEARDAKIEAEIEELACQVLGTKRSDFMGGGRDPSDSIVFKVGALFEQSQNGGIKTKLSKGIVALMVAMIGAIGYIGQAVIIHDDSGVTVEQLDQKFDELRQEILNELP